MKRILLILTGLLAFAASTEAQPSQLVIDQKDGSITFAVDEVSERPERPCGWERSGIDLAKEIHSQGDGLFFSDWQPEILTASFADAEDLYYIGEDVLFQMLLKAWCQHRSVVLTPDAIWMVICQQFSHYVNQDPEAVRGLMVSHEGKKELKVQSFQELFTEPADWEAIIAGFTAEIDKYTSNGLAGTLVADFSTTGTPERIASEVTLMDVVKPYFEYITFYAVCGIPSITLTGTPEDWRKVLEKTRSLELYGLGWWVKDLEPILEEFIKASEGHPDRRFWRSIVSRSRPDTIQGPSCARRQPRQTRFDGWFLKLFPFDNDGRSPRKVTITQTMLPETVAVPFKYQIVTPEMKVLSEMQLELVAGIVGVHEDMETFTMTPRIGWFVRTVKSEEIIQREQFVRDSLGW